MKCLLVCINSDEFYTGDTLINHTVYCVVSGTAHTDYQNSCSIIRLIYLNL